MLELCGTGTGTGLACRIGTRTTGGGDGLISFSAFFVSTHEREHARVDLIDGVVHAFVTVYAYIMDMRPMFIALRRVCVFITEFSIERFTAAAAAAMCGAIRIARDSFRRCFVVASPQSSSSSSPSSSSDGRG